MNKSSELTYGKMVKQERETGVFFSHLNSDNSLELGLKSVSLGHL